MFKNLKKKIFPKKYPLKDTSVSRAEIEKRVEEGTEFTIQKYGDVLDALAKFDKASV